MNTQEFIKKIELWAGGLALGIAGVLAYMIARSVSSFKKYHRKFDIETVEDLKGRILEVTTDSDKHDETRGIMLILETEDEEIVPVHLGPEWFIRHQQIRFKSDTKITVTGSRVSHRDNSILVASEVQFRDKKLVLRDENGDPRWQSMIKQNS